MSEVLQANIFFVITSIAVVIFTILVCVALYQVIKILMSARRVMNRIESGTEAIVLEATKIKENLTHGGFFKNILRSIFAIRDSQKPKARRRKDVTSEETEVDEI